MGPRPPIAMPFLLPQATSCFCFLFVCWGFFPVPGAALRAQHLATGAIVGVHLFHCHPLWLLLLCAGSPGEGEEMEKNRSILYIFDALTFATNWLFAWIMWIKYHQSISLHCGAHFPGPSNIPLPPQTEICIRRTGGHNNNGCVSQSLFSKHRKWMKSPSVALYPSALILWITSSEKRSAGHARELSHLLSAVRPRLQEEKPLKLKKKVMVAEQSLWGALSSGKDSLLWNSLGPLISRACYKKHPSAHTGDDHDVCRKRRICASSVTSEGRVWSPAVSVDSKLPFFFTFF